jgi:hypothetical protein
MWTCTVCGKRNPRNEFICTDKHCDALTNERVPDETSCEERLNLVVEFYKRIAAQDHRHTQTPFDLAFMHAIEELRAVWSDS